MAITDEKIIEIYNEANFWYACPDLKNSEISYYLAGLIVGLETAFVGNKTLSLQQNLDVYKKHLYPKGPNHYAHYLDSVYEHAKNQLEKLRAKYGNDMDKVRRLSDGQ